MTFSSFEGPAPSSSSRYVSLAGRHHQPRLTRPSSSRPLFTFSPASNTRAMPLSAALLSRRDASSDVYILPRVTLDRPKSLYDEDRHAWGDDEFSDDEAESDYAWSDDGSEAGDEWETRDGLLVLPPKPDLRPHPRLDFVDYDGDSVYELDPADDQDDATAAETPALTPSRAVPFFTESEASSSSEESEIEEPTVGLSLPRRTASPGHKNVEDLDRLLHHALALKGYDLSNDGFVTAVEFQPIL